MSVVVQALKPFVLVTLLRNTGRLCRRLCALRLLLRSIDLDIAARSVCVQQREPANHCVYDPMANACALNDGHGAREADRS